MSCRDALLADSDTSGRIQPTPSERRQSWHYDTPTSLAFYYRTKALPSDYGPAGLLEQGQRRRIRRSRRTVLWGYGPEEAASSRRRAVGTTGPFQGPRADREQRTPPSIPPGPQYLSRNYWPDGSAGWLCRSALRQADDTTMRPSGSGPMSQSDARNSKFGPSFNTQIDRRGSGPAAKSPVEVNLFYATPAYLTFGAEA